MGLTTDFKQVQLSGLKINNPTSLQFGPDGRLYVSQQNGIIKIAELEAITDSQGKITGYEVVGDVETINLVKEIPNHDDDGALNTNINNRQVTGLVVEQDAQGNPVLYVSSSDPRIGGNSSGADKNLDTNSGIISRLTLTDSSAPLGDSRWTKVELIIGLPRSEENHSTNGMDIRTEIVDGEKHQIMYVASGGNTNKGAPSNNFAWLPEYYYSTAVLRVDLTKLEQLEATEGLKGGTDYVDSYIYALPTLNDPTRADDAQGRDTANGTTGEQDAEAADTFGGNNGLNQAKYDPKGIVQVYSNGYRNHYDVVITEAGNLYTFDNGPNNGWGDKPLTADGKAVNSIEQVGTNNPNIDVNTGNDSDPDNLHLVTEGFYGGHPHPVYASGADAGLYRVDTSSGSPVVTKLTDPSDPNNDPTTTADDLPSDWDTIAGGFTHPEADVYKSPGADGSLWSIWSSSNGLTEYTASGVSDNPNAEVLAVAPFNGKITFIELESDGTQSGTKVTDTEYVQVNGTPLDLTAVGNNGIDGSGQFAGTVWIAQFGADGIAILTPGTPPAPDLDQDDDGLDDNIDPLQYDSANGVNTVLNAGQALFWDFNPSDSGENPGKGTSAEGPFNIGMTGWMVDGDKYLDGLRNLDNTIRGGAPGVVQVKSVGSGDLSGSNNTQQDAIQTGFMPSPNVKEFRIKVPIFNPFASDANNGIDWSDSASMGFTLGDGSMSNFLQIAVGAKNASGSPLAPVLRVSYEENDLTITELEIDANELLNSVDDDLVELFLDVDLATYQVSPSWRFQTNGVWSPTQQISDNPVQLDVEGQIVKSLQGQFYLDGVQSAPVVTLTSTSNGSEPFTADFLDLTIESTAAFPNVLIQETDGNTKVTEGGSQDSYSLVLTSQPTSEVKVTLAPDTQLTLDRTEVVFTSENWDTPQLVNISAVDDTLTEGNQTVTIAHSVASADSDYDGLSIPELTVDAIDNDGPNVLYRINVGGAQVAAADGSLDWSEDTNTNPSPYRVGSGGANIYATGNAIDITDSSLPAGVSKTIFQTERWDPSSGSTMQWEFSVAPGDYEVRLFLAEIYAPIDLAGERLFDVAVEGSIPAVFDNIDPFASAGQYSGLMLSHTTDVTDGALNLEFFHEIQNPALKGIEILSVLPVVSIDDVTVNEDAGTATFTVNLSQASSSEVTVDFATIDSTAVAGEDYTDTNGTLTFAVGETTQTISVDLTDDNLVEADETLKVQLFKAIGANIVNEFGIGTLVDNDESVLDSNVLYRINVGGAQVAAADGSLDWSEDTNTNPSSYRIGSGGANIYSTTSAIDLSNSSLPAAVPEAIFQTERYDLIAGETMQWEFGVASGDYEVRLFLAEIYNPIDVSGERVFDVVVEGSVPAVFDNIDPFAGAGQYSGFMLSYTTTVTDGALNLEFLHDTEHPALKGIEILSVLTDDHDGDSVPIDPQPPTGNDNSNPDGSGSEEPLDDHDGDSASIDPQSPTGNDNSNPDGSGSEEPLDDHDGDSAPIDPQPPTDLNLTGGTAQIAYVAYYGRPADNSGLEFWNDVLTENKVNYAPRQGDRLTGSETDIYNRIIDAFGNSVEADRLFGGFSSNRERVNQVYQFAFNRDGDKEGLDYWTEQIDRSHVTLASFALEVALGAQNNDVVVLNNKIESSDLFTKSIDTQAEINAYRGYEAGIFGRNWLSNYGLTTTTVAEVDSTMNELVG
ncbi:malectin domain-containing carbohydrate-binding protein [Myxosarcina sp. GI1(2024)]